MLKQAGRTPLKPTNNGVIAFRNAVVQVKQLLANHDLGCRTWSVDIAFVAIDQIKLKDLLVARMSGIPIPAKKFRYWRSENLVADLIGIRHFPKTLSPAIVWEHACGKARFVPIERRTFPQ